MERILVSDPSVNSFDLSVRTLGIDLSRFLGNPIMLFNHQRADKGKTDEVLPIGTWKDLTIEGDQLYATPVFDETDEFALRIMKKYQAGVLRAASIAISIQESSYDEQKKIITLEKTQLQEISIVDIPSNQNAVAIYDDKDQLMSNDAILALASGLAKPKLQIQPLTMNFEQTAAQLGLKADATDVQLSSAILTLKAELDAAKANIATHNQENADRQAAQVVSLIDDAITAKKINADQKPTYTKLANADFDSTKAILESMTAAVRLSDIPKPGGKGDAATHEAKTFTQLRKEDPKFLLSLKKSDPAKYEELYNAYVAE